MEMIKLQWNNINLVHLFPLWWISQQKSIQVRNNIYSTQLFNHCTSQNALKLLWLMTHTSLFFSQQENFSSINNSSHLLFNWVMASDHWRVTLKRELIIMISSRKITYKRNKLCESWMFHLYALTLFATINFSNTSAAINAIFVLFSSNQMCISKWTSKLCLMYSINSKEWLYDCYLKCHNTSTDSTSPL